MAYIRVSDFEVRRVAQYIVEQHTRFLSHAADTGLDYEAIKFQSNSAFQQLTGISLVFVGHKLISDTVSDCQAQVWDKTNEYFGFSRDEG